MPHDTAIPECPDTIRWGRRAPIFVPTPEWILVAGLSPQAQALYTQLLAHVNRKRGDGVAWPGMDALAELLGYSRRQSVVRYVRELADIGAIDVTVEPTATGRRNVYVVNEIVADGYAGITSLAEFHAARKARRRGSDALAPHPSGGVAHDRSDAVADQNQTNATRRTDPDEVTSSDASCGADSPPSEARPNSVQTTLKGKIDLWIPENYPDMTDGKAMNQLIRSAYGALKRVGYVPAPDMRSRLTAGLRNTLDRGYSLEALYDLTVTSLEQIGGDGMWGDLAYPIESIEAKAS